MSDLATYLQAIKRHAQRFDGKELSKLVALPLKKEKNGSSSVELTSDKKKFLEKMKASGVKGAVEAQSELPSALIGAVIGHLLCIHALAGKDIEGAFKNQLDCYDYVCSYLNACSPENDTTWIIPVFTKVADDMRRLAQIDDANKGTSQSITRCISKYQTTFTSLQYAPLNTTDNRSSKKLVFIYIANLQLKIYFKLHNLQNALKIVPLCDNVLRDAIELFPLSDVTTYKYYNGRLKMFSDELEDAAECLTWALDHTPLNCIKNRQLILTSLIPVNMVFHGIFPTEVVGTKYGLQCLVDIANAVKVGNIKVFEDLMELHQESFLKLGIYLVLERLKTVAYRCLYKRIYKIIGDSRVHLSIYEHVMKSLGEEVDLDEIECIISNLIWNNKVKGYLHHKRRTLVLDKRGDPFPSERSKRQKASEGR
jgi:hypothetical protein